MRPDYDPELQAIAAYAAETLGAPVALLGDDRRTVLAEVGFNPASAALLESFCAHAIREDGVLEVPDATADPRFADTPLVVGEPPVRFVAGVPLASPEGFRRATLCVVGREPRCLDASERRTLLFLARQAAARLLVLDREHASLRAETARAASETRYRDLFGSMMEGFCVIEMEFDAAGKAVDYRFLEVNAAFEPQTGIDPAHVERGTRVRDLIAGHEEHWFEVYGEVARTGRSASFDLPAAGLGRWYAVSAYRIGGEGSRQVGVVFNDITQDRADAAALRASEAHYRSLFASIDDGFCTFETIFDADGRCVDYRFLEVNDAFVAQTGLSRETALGGLTIRGIAPGHEQRWFDLYGRVALSGEPLRIEDEARELGRRYEIHAFRIGGEGSREVGAIFKDVTARHAAARAILAERTRLDETLRTAGVATFDWDIPGDRIVGNLLLNLYYGFPEGTEGFTIASVLARIRRDEGATRRDSTARALAQGGGYEAQYRMVGADGRERWLLARGDVRLDADGRAAQASGVVLDVTERVGAEEAIRRIEADRRRALEGAGIGAWNIAVPSLELSGDPRFWELFGIPEGTDYEGAFAVLHPDDREGVRRAVAAAINPVAPAPYTTEYRVERRDGSVRWLAAAGRGNFQGEGADRIPVSVDGTVFDVTDRRRAEDALREREELFRAVFEQAPDDAILVMDADRTLTAWNPAAERITGWTAVEAVGNSADLIFTPEDRAAGVPPQETEGAARRGKADDERWHLRRDGTRFWGSGTMNALHDAEGRVTGFLKVFRDATERYEEVRSLAFLRRVSDAMIVLRSAEDIVATVARLLGEHLSVARVLYADVAEDLDTFTVRDDWTRSEGMPSLVGVYTLSSFAARIAANLRDGKIDVIRDADAEFDGGERAALRAGSTAAAITVPIARAGRLVGLVAVNDPAPRVWTADEIGLVRQVTDRLAVEVDRARAESELRASEERFRAAQETTPDPFTIIEAVRDAAGRVVDFRWTYVNPATESLTGETESEQLGALVSERRPGLKDGPMWNGWLRTLETGEPFVIEQFMDFPRGRHFLRVTCVKVGDGIGSAFLDLTQRQLNVERLEEAVADRTADLQRAVGEAEGFNYSISHDLRTPLRAMVSTSSILLEELGPNLDEEYVGLLQRQAHNARRMGRLIDELLRLSRLARVAVNRQPLDLTAMAGLVFADLQAHERTNGCRFEAAEGMVATGDPELVRTVVHNLVGNACKFSPQGGTIRMTQADGVLSVSDEGVGFDMRFAPKVFLPFERLVSDAEFEGTGIGLANVKRIVERHDGRVGVKSEPGKGTTFFFTLEPPNAS